MISKQLSDATMPGVSEQQLLDARVPGVDNDQETSPEKASISAKEILSIGVEPDVRNENRVVQKLLQAPRYFNPQECSWRSPNECDENDIEENTHKAKRKPKPCFICGVIGHKGTRCGLVNGCFICSRKGHLATTCPRRNVKVDSASVLCLRCGITGHDMFLCSNDYDSEDLKAIECYICRNVGHLFCADNKTKGRIASSCYRCGQSGHFGSECTKLIKICRKCGESGHSRKQCTKIKVSSVKVGTVASGRTARTKARRVRNKQKRRLISTAPASQSQPRAVFRPQILGPSYGNPGPIVWLPPAEAEAAAVSGAKSHAGAVTSHQHMYHQLGKQALNYSGTLQSASSSTLGFPRAVIRPQILGLCHGNPRPNVWLRPAQAEAAATSGAKAHAGALASHQHMNHQLGKQVLNYSGTLLSASSMLGFPRAVIRPQTLGPCYGNPRPNVWLPPAQAEAAATIGAKAHAGAFTSHQHMYHQLGEQVLNYFRTLQSNSSSTANFPGNRK